MNNWHPWQLSKSESWGPFWSYQLDSTANPAHYLNGPNWPNWQYCLASSSRTAPRILIFSIILGAKCSFYVKSNATYAPQFFWYNNSVLGLVDIKIQDLIAQKVYLKKNPYMWLHKRFVLFRTRKQIKLVKVIWREEWSGEHRLVHVLLLRYFGMFFWDENLFSFLTEKKKSCLDQ